MIKNIIIIMLIVGWSFSVLKTPAITKQQLWAACMSGATEAILDTESIKLPEGTTVKQHADKVSAFCNTLK